MDITNDEKKRLFSLFKNMDVVHEDTVPRTFNSEVLIIDGLNTFFRCFMAIPSLNENGLHVGGIAGVLQSIGSAIKILNPTRVVIIFDGNGGSMKRRKIYPEYKQNRSTKLRYNRSYEDLSSPEQEERSVQSQLLRLIGYFDTLPISVMSLDHVEADDVIAYAAQEYFKDSHKVYIMSTDKDFLQIVNNKIQVWSPTKRKLYGCAEILLEYGISCENFINYRILNGDVSDNIDGISGAGLKTILKCFPQLVESRYYSLQELYMICEENKKKYKLYNSILENKNILSRNLELMQLTNSQLQPFSQLRVHEILDKPVAKLNRIKFSTLITEDRMWNNIPNYHTWLSDTFGKLLSNIE